MTHFETDMPLHLFHHGENFEAYRLFGAHKCVVDGKRGYVFRVWAPRAESVSVIGAFNNWDDYAHPMQRMIDGETFELFSPGLKKYDTYKYCIKTEDGRKLYKADPYAFHAETPPKTASKIYDIDGYEWGDDEFIKNKKPPYDSPMNIYEVNLASWKRKENGDYLSYAELSKDLVDYVSEMGYTHVEFMPISEYPFDGSWGYQVTGYYSVTSRFGTPKDFMGLVDAFHKKGISVIVDWVPAHFPKDEHGLYEFDGSCCYENQGWDRKEHKTWGTRIFDWGRNEVQSFLVSNALYLLEKFHVDGLRVDAVASMLYLDYDRKDGEWIPNEQGGNYNLQAIEFFKKLNTAVFKRFPNALMIAEESTAFPMITKPVSMGGLGFNYKWNMGWMNDVTSYMATDPYFRSYVHNKLTFSMMYAFSENYVLPISHDEVVHGKKSLLDKMPGDIEQKFANLRTFLLYMFAHPGKKLSFMGNEFGQFKEWNYQEGLEFFMLKFDLHNKLHEFNKKLNKVYKSTPPLYNIEDGWDGFEWISTDEKDNNIVIFSRKDKNKNLLIAILNFSGNDYKGYSVGCEKGEYKLIISSDEQEFGGSGKIKTAYRARKEKAHSKEYSIKIDLPKFSGAYFLRKIKKVK